VTDHTNQDQPPPAGRHVVAGAGPLGRAVVDVLIAQGIRPVVVTRSGRAVVGADARAADLSVTRTAVEALADAAVVYQCAQPEYHRWPEEFPQLQTAILEGASRAGAVFVAAENMYGYGPADRPLQESMSLAATTRKGRVRAQMWRQLEEAHRAGHVRATAARAADFYGPGVRDSAVGDRFVPRVLAGKPVDVIGDLDRLHSVTYVPDFAEALVRIGREPAAWGRAWHVPNAPAVSNGDLVRLAAQLAGTDSAPRHLPTWKLRVAGVFIKPAREVVEMVYEFEEEFVVDDRAYRSAFGADATSLGDGLAATLDWYRSHAS
jgi:nucleoside-diphosphate-sugar epimerase